MKHPYGFIIFYSFWYMSNSFFFAARFLGLPFAPPYMNLSELERRTTTTGLNFASASSGILPETGSFTVRITTSFAS
jgi:hypothetical protein